MKVFLNKSVLTLTSANIMETIGISIFNIILLTYAKNFSNPNLAVSIVSIAMVIPGILGFIAGRLADKSIKKSNYLIASKLVQAVLYVVLSLIINQHNYFIFLIIVLINVFSDFLGLYSNNLRMPIIKEKVDPESTQQVLGINQSIAVFLQPVGQALGVMIIGITSDYVLAGIINAITFLLTAVILYFGRNDIDTQSAKKVESVASETESIIKRTMKVLSESAELDIFHLLSSLVIVNAIGSSIDGIINLFLIDNPNLSIFPFAVEILLINIAFVAGTFLGSIMKIKIVDNLAFKSTMTLTVLLMILTYFNFILFKNYYVLVLLMFMVSFLLIKINTKLNAKVLEIADEDIIGSIFGTLGSLMTVSVPIGSILIILIYNSISPNMAYYVSIIALVIGMILLLRSKK